MFTKTQIEIMKLFVSQINRRFSIKEATEILKKPYPLIHRSIKSLIEQKFIQKDEKGLISLNYKENHSKLTYVESLRSELYILDVILSLKDLLILLSFSLSSSNFIFNFLDSSFSISSSFTYFPFDFI